MDQGIRRDGYKDRDREATVSQPFQLPFFLSTVDILNRYRMLRDAEQFQTKMGKIEGAGDLGERLVQLAQAKSVTEQASTEKASSPSKEQGEEESTSGTS